MVSILKTVSKKDFYNKTAVKKAAGRTLTHLITFPLLRKSSTALFKGNQPLSYNFIILS